MLQSKKNKSNPLWIALKLLIAALALWFIYKRVFEKENAEDWWAGAGAVLREPANQLYFIVVIALMIFNWTIEAIKWRFAMRRLEELSLWKSLEAIFSGITVSFFTPNRIGEYAGRVFILQKADRIEATLATVIENFSQLIVTLVFGAVASVVYLNLYLNVPDHIEIAIMVLLITVATGSLFLFFNIAIVESVFKKLRLPEKWNKYFKVFSIYPNRDLLYLLVLAMFRYLVFSGQFYILLDIFGVQLAYPTALMFISVTYLVMSVVPTFALTELGVRGAIATYFFAAVTNNLTGVVNASFSLWLINLAFPALLGIFFVFEFKFARKTT